MQPDRIRYGGDSGELKFRDGRKMASSDVTSPRGKSKVKLSDKGLEGGGSATDLLKQT